MSKFRVTYPSGSVEIAEQSDCHTLEQFVNTKFGSSDYVANGVIVERVQGADDMPDSEWLRMADAARDEGMADQAVVDALIASAELGVGPAFTPPKIDEQKSIIKIDKKNKK